MTAEKTLTEVDSALAAAREDKNQANFFFDAFLNAEVFVPALRADKQPGDWRKLAASERFFPLYLRQGEARAIPVFDRLDKLKFWAGDKAFDYLALQTHLLLRVIAPEIAIVLNEGTDYRYLFVPEVLEQMRNEMKPVSAN